MTRNTFEDGTEFSVAALNSIKHAFQGEGVESGGALSPGTGDWDVDITATDYTVGDSGGFSLTADTVTVSNPGAEDRVDLITATTAPAFNVVEGSVASTTDKPNAPDIPTDEVLIGLVYVDSEASSLAAADLFDGYKTPVQNVENWTTQGAEGTVPVSQGDGSLSMQPNTVPNWSKDGTDTVSGASGFDYTLSSTYDFVMVHFQGLSGSSTNLETLELQINGDTGTNYGYVLSQGTSTTNANFFTVLESNPGNGGATGVLYMDGRWSGPWYVGHVGSGQSLDNIGQSGRNTAVSPPLNSIQLGWETGTITGTIEVYGRDTG